MSAVSPLGFFRDRGIDLTELGGAYLVLLLTALLTWIAFAAARKLLVISPNRGARDYGIYVAAALATLLVATVLENELLPVGVTLHYVAIPQLLMLLGLHWWIAQRQDTWLISLGAAATAATLVVVLSLGLTTDLLGPAHWITLLVLAALLCFLWRKTVSTKHGFKTSSSIYIGTKEMRALVITPQKPWLGLAQWSALIVASVALAVANSLLRGRGLEEIPAVDVVAESGLVLLATAVICAIPAVAYWVTRKTWMPELTRFVWLTWIIVGFAMTYGNYLNSLTRV